MAQPAYIQNIDNVEKSFPNLFYDIQCNSIEAASSMSLNNVQISNWTDIIALDDQWVTVGATGPNSQYIYYPAFDVSSSNVAGVAIGSSTITDRSKRLYVNGNALVNGSISATGPTGYISASQGISTAGAISAESSSVLLNSAVGGVLTVNEIAASSPTGTIYIDEPLTIYSTVLGGYSTPTSTYAKAITFLTENQTSTTQGANITLRDNLATIQFNQPMTFTYSSGNVILSGLPAYMNPTVDYCTSFSSYFYDTTSSVYILVEGSVRSNNTIEFSCPLALQIITNKFTAGHVYNLSAFTVTYDLSGSA